MLIHDDGFILKIFSICPLAFLPLPTDGFTVCTESTPSKSWMEVNFKPGDTYSKHVARNIWAAFVFSWAARITLHRRRAFEVNDWRLAVRSCRRGVRPPWMFTGDQLCLARHFQMALRTPHCAV